MASNKTVLVGGTVIISVGVVNATVNKGSPTKVLVGGITFILLASLLELGGPGPSRLASALVGVAVLTVVLVEAPGIGKAFNNVAQNIGKPPLGTAPKTATDTNPNPAPGGTRRYY